ncbi:MAG: DUF1211 domain-containing protein [Chroococcidiopsidaceae cyanobacterium CP_BM_ER_R8_30]|nr:DUF1211 domain-containing protein [Chroococcidiopsidaceae cyanobacterium CP_BM_ER_R8_30]
MQVNPTSDEKETGRIEAFSDGVFAIAITLLVLNIRVPQTQEVLPSLGLLTLLLRQWPFFLAFFLSFMTILVMWVNHHTLFNHIRRTDGPFLFLNGFLLLLVTFVPFPTALLAEFIEHSEAKVAAVVYSGTYLCIALAFSALWKYASTNYRLLDKHISRAQVERINIHYRVGPPAYLVAFVVSFLNVAASVGICMLLALWFTYTASFSRRLNS